MDGSDVDWKALYQGLLRKPRGCEWHSLCLESVGLLWLVRFGVKDPVELCSVSTCGMDGSDVDWKALCHGLLRKPRDCEWHSLCLESVGLFWLVTFGVKDPVELCSFNQFLLALWMGQMSTKRPYTKSSSRTLRPWVTLLVLGVSWAVLIGQIWSKGSCGAAFC